MKIGRITLAVFLLLLAAAAGVTVYYQTRTARLLREALAAAKDYPQRAYVLLRPVRELGDRRTFGEASRATEEMVMEIYSQSVRRLMAPDIEPGAFFYAQNTLGVLQTLKSEGYGGLDGKIASIMKAARDSVDRIGERGSHVAWQEANKFFAVLKERNHEIPPAVFEDYDAWLERLEDRNKAEGPTIYLRDIRQQIARVNLESREMLGFDASNIVAQTVLPLPADLTDVVCLNLDAGLRKQLDDIDAYERGYAQYSTGTLEATKGFLHYNRAALMGQHLIDRGTVVRRMGSSYVSQHVIPRGMENTIRQIPPPDQLADLFRKLAIERLREAERAYYRAEVATAERAGAMALRFRLEMDLLPEGSEERDDAAFMMEEWLALTNEKYLEAVRSAPGRPLFLLRMPAETHHSGT